MKNIFISLVFIMLMSTTSITAQSWQWAQSAGSIGTDRGVFMCSDLVGNIYIASTISASCNFQTDTFVVNGFNDFVIVKYDAVGNELWAKQFGGPNTNMINIKTESITDIKFDPIGNCIYATGGFVETINFGGIILNSTPNLEQAFIAKFDLNGNCIWAKKVGSAADDAITKITTDPSGNLFIAGSFPFAGAIDTLAVQAGGFLAKCDSIGTGLWAKKIFSNHFGADPAYGIITLKYLYNDLFMSGYSLDSVTIDTIAFTKTNYQSQILTRWDGNGNIKWARQFSGPNGYWSSKMSFDNLGNLFCAGVYNGTYAVFGTDSIYSSDPANAFIVKYDTSGTKLWLKQINTSQNLYCWGNYSDGDGNFYFSGNFSGSANFDSYTVTSGTSEDMYLARYNTSGDCLGVRHSGEATAYDVISDLNGNAFVTGEFKTTVNFDSYSLTSNGDYDMFVAKIAAFTGIGGEERTINNQLLIYANPTAGKCNITVPDEFKNDKNLTLSIYASDGKLIQQKTLSMAGDKIKLNLEAEAKGVYNVTLSNGLKSYSGKIVFEAP